MFKSSSGDLRSIKRTSCKMVKEIESIIDLPLKSRYRLLMWHGLANGANLTLGFNIADILGRTIVLKSFAIYPYTVEPYDDFFVTDGVNNWTEIIPGLTRINRVFDKFGAGGTIISCIINGSPIGIFQNLTTVIGFPLDIALDNIFYEHPAKIQTWDMQVTSTVVSDLALNTQVVPNVKVVVECYLI